MAQVRKRRAPSQRVHSDNEESWAVDKRIPIALIVAMAAQLAGIGFWVGGLQGDITVVKRDVSALTAAAKTRDSKLERLIALERDIKHVSEAIKRMEGTVDRILQNEYRQARQEAERAQRANRPQQARR